MRNAHYAVRVAIALVAAVAVAVPLGGSAKPSHVTHISCPNPEGGTCLGPLTPGTHKTSTFSPKITYSVGSGWSNDEDLPGNFALSKWSDTDASQRVLLNVFRQARVSLGCDEAVDPRAGHSAEALVANLESKPSLQLTNKHRVTVDGLHGWSVDLALKPGSAGQCTDPELPGFSFTPTAIGNGVSSFWWSISAYGSETYILLDWHHDNLLIVESNLEGGAVRYYRAADAPVLRSLRFSG